MRTKEEVKILEEEVKILFLNFNIKPPKRILPEVIFDWMTSEHCFKTRMRTILSEILTSKNFIGVSWDNELIMKPTHNKEQLIMLINEDKRELVNNIKKKLLDSGIDLTTF